MIARGEEIFYYFYSIFRKEVRCCVNMVSDIGHLIFKTAKLVFFFFFFSGKGSVSLSFGYLLLLP